MIHPRPVRSCSGTLAGTTEKTVPSTAIAELINWKLDHFVWVFFKLFIYLFLCVWFFKKSNIS